MVSVWLCKRRIALFLSLLLAFFQAAAICAEPPAEPAGDNRPANSASGGDMVFSAQKWSIVPVGAARESAKTARFAGNKFVPLSEPGKITSAAPFRQTEVLPGAAASAAPAATKTLKLYGRIEELCAVRGAKIPLKMRAMTPIRDSSLDAKIAVNNTRLPGHATMLGYLPLPKTQAQSPSQLFIGAQQNEPSILPPVPQAAYPPDYQGIWSGEMTVYMVDYDRSYFEFDRAEAEKQQQLVKEGRKGSCSVTFYEGPNRTVEMSPTQIVFSAPLGAAVQEMSQGNPALAALAGLVGSPNNSQLSNSRVPEFALPLGNMTSGRGVTGNQLGAELMKNTLKELAKGVLEQQVVTRDSDRNQSGQVKTTFTESDLRFTRVSSSRLSCQAAAVTYDSHGNYLNKIILAGMLDKGAPVENANPMNVNLFGGFDMNSLSSPSSGNSNSFGNSNPPGNPGSFGDPASLGNMFGGNGSGSGQGAPGANLIEQMQQVQKMLKDMDAH